MFFCYLVPPEAPVIVGGSKMKAVDAGKTENLTCHSAFGNPAPTITWKKNGVVVAGAISHSYLAGKFINYSPGT